MRLAVLILAVMFLAVGSSWAQTTAPAKPPGPAPTSQSAGTPPGPVIDAARYFDPNSPTCGLQEAIDAVSPAGGVVVIPPGVYTLRRGLVLRSGLALRGSGAATVLRKHPAFMSLLAANCPIGAREIEVKDTAGFEVGSEIGVWDRENGGWHVTHAIVKAVKGGRVSLDRPTTRQYQTGRGALAVNFFPALTAEAQSALAIESLQIDGNLPRQPADAPIDFTFAAVHLVNCTRARASDLWVTLWPGDGISVQGGSDIQVIGCTVSRCRGHGFHPGTSLTNAVFTGNIARENGWDGLYFCAKVRYCTVSGNVFSFNGWSGIGGLGDGGDEWNTCSANTCVANGRAGIQVNNGRNNTATGNVCVNNSRSAPGQWAGIAIQNAAACLVTGNRCGDDQTPPTQHVGIAESGQSDHNLISGNHLGGSKKAVDKVGPHTQAVGNLE